MKVERLKEKWFEFDRYHFKEGFIDVYKASSVINPNNEQKPFITQQALVKYYRLNGGDKWCNSSLFKSDWLFDEKFDDKYTSKEIWYRDKFPIRTEELSEKWYKFKRYYFEQGYIDEIESDSAQDFNSDEKINFRWNDFVKFYRLNDGMWFRDNHFTHKIRNEIRNKINLWPVYDFSITFDNSYTSEEIWNRYFSE